MAAAAATGPYGPSVGTSQHNNNNSNKKQRRSLLHRIASATPPRPPPPLPMPMPTPMPAGSGPVPGFNAGNVAAKTKKTAKRGKDGIGGKHYYAVEKIVDKRMIVVVDVDGDGDDGDAVEYKVRWEGRDETEDTWEPFAHMQESVPQLVLRFEEESTAAASTRPDPASTKLEHATKQTDAGKKNLERREKGGPRRPCGSRKTPLNDDVRRLEEDRLATAVEVEDWSDQGQIRFRRIRRVCVSDPDAGRIVHEAREVGTPVCVTGHRGWAQFAAEWLVPARSDGDDEADDVGGHLDLTRPYRIDIEKMKADIGNEVVPVIKKKYDVYDPIGENKRGGAKKKQRITVSQFLDQCWAAEPESGNGTEKKLGGTSALYLHQWQFPSSETGAKLKLCGHNNHIPLPEHILGDNLLRYYDEDDTNPFQYLFMGREDTFTKMHADPGGFLVSIAPIVGEKEVTLAHRADGECLSDLDVDLDKVDLNNHPLAPSVRIWRSVIKPGELLLMPAGTFHQCRNVTPCLSFSQLHLDYLNLRPVYDSIRRQDAMDIPHLSMLWNASKALSARIDRFSEIERKRLALTKCSDEPDPIPDSIRRAAQTLQSLRNWCCAISRRDADPNFEPDDWQKFFFDVDTTIHDLQHRGSFPLPLFRQKWVKSAKSSINKGRTCTDIMMDKKGRKLLPQERGMELADSVLLEVGYNVAVRFDKENRVMPGEILEIRHDAPMVYLQYELSAFADEYQPIESLRLKVSRENSVEVCGDKIQAGMKVYQNTHGVEYAAEVLSKRRGTFYLVRHDSSSTHWHPRASFMQVLNMHERVQLPCPSDNRDSPSVMQVAWVRGRRKKDVSAIVEEEGRRLTPNDLSTMKEAMV